ncbi:MAG: fumarylacetoacetate hydrolase family protein [Armatimonadota bacterium]|nr:fumarylacetoacetate hydrolase family protein [Armatimonadota bacterium]MDR7496716.1 fumarylacetoacetate hydrolase family protein [Armatimonadota bacterium]MDR7511195.1 fumarylacetoacetate hydrolase family protein [Armatimonadota bacterium]
MPSPGARFALATIWYEGAAVPVLVAGDRLIDLREAPVRARRVLDLLAAWEDALPALERLAASAAPGLAVGPLRWLPPVLGAAYVFCAAANYRSHLEEMAAVMGTAPRPAAEPFFFVKTARNALLGDGEPIRLPARSRLVDWEVELAVVVGRRGRHIAPERAMDCVAGYTVFNDVSARDLNRRTDGQFPHDWLSGKCADTFGPCGPVFLPARFVEDWRALRLRLWVNGVLKQDAPAGEMLFGIAEQIAYLSRTLTLEPGDLIATGTPAGVGMARGESLRPGDVVVTEVEGIGRLTNPVIAERPVA